MLYKLIFTSISVGISLFQLKSASAQTSPKITSSPLSLSNPSILELPTSPSEVKVQQVQSLTLKQALKLAEKSNRELQIAALTLKRSQAALRQAQGAWYPNLALSTELVQVDDQENPTELIFETESSSPAFLNGTVELSYDVFTFGKRSARIKAAQKQLQFDQLELERLQQQIQLDVINAYYDLQEADEQVRISQAAVRNARLALRDARALEEGGLGTQLDIARATVQLKNAEQELIQAQTQQDLASDRLTRILGLSETIDVAAADPVEVGEEWNRSLEETIIQAFQNRAEFKQQLIQRDISLQQRRVTLSEVRPNLGLFANYQAEGELSEESKDGFAVGARVRWNFFDGGITAAAAKQEAVNAQIAEVRFADLRNQIRLEVEQAYKNLIANAKNIETATIALQQAEKALELVSFGYSQDASTQLEVNIAQNELTQAAGNRVRAITNYNRSLALLQRAINQL